MQTQDRITETPGQESGLAQTTLHAEKGTGIRAARNGKYCKIPASISMQVWDIVVQ